MAFASITSKICRKCRIEKSINDFCKSKFTKDGMRSYCKQCHSENNLAWRSINPNYRKDYYKVNKEAEKKKSANRDRKNYYFANKEAINAKSRKWARDNPARCAARAMQRISIKNRATPGWADIGKIEELYELAAQKRLQTGEKWHVDHIVPLKSKVVCGLHVICNLQLILAAENIAKSNRYWPQMPK